MLSDIEPCEGCEEGCDDIEGCDDGVIGGT